MGATLIGIAGLTAAAATTATALATNKSNRSYGIEQSEEARKWSTNERLASQDYNTQERLAAQEYNTQERLAAQEYNSIGNQVGQFRAAGLNPNVLSNAVGFQGATPQHSQGASSSPASAPLSGIGTAQVPNIPQLISSGADLVNALSKREETQATIPLLNEQVQNWILKNAGQETLNDLMALEKTLKESTLPNDIKKSFEELAKLGFEKVVAHQLGKKYEADAELAKVEKRVQEQVEKLTGENAIVANFVRMNWHRQFNSMLNLQSSQAAANYGSAEASHASAQKMYSEKEFQDMVNSIKRGSINEELNSVLSSYAAQSQENKAKTEEFKTMLHRYETLNKNNENGAADYLNYLMWFVKEQMPSLPIVPFLKLGK